ncbi:MAG: protein phosphatase 2C domain-containing protein [Bacteroidota bacterium]
MSDTTQASGGDATALPTRHIIESDEPMLFAVAGTHHGRTRDANQDTFLCEAAGEFGLYAAIDGVGGYAGGHVAAALARDRIRAHVGRLSSAPEELLREAVINANNAIVERSEGDADLSQMACVLTVALVDPQQQRVYAAHVGDTRLYHRQGNTITKLTPDHSFVGLREDAGQLSEAEAMQHPRRNEILRDVGSERRTVDDPDFVFTTEAAFQDGDALMLCSDGLTDLVPSSELTRLMVEHRGDPRRIVNELVHAALEAGGSDNVTAVVVEYSASGEARAIPAAPRERGSDTREFPPDAFAPAAGAAPSAPPEAVAPAEAVAPPAPAAASVPTPRKGRVPGWAKVAMSALALLLVAGAGYIGYQRFLADDVETTPEASGDPVASPPDTGTLDTDDPPAPAPAGTNSLQSRIEQRAGTVLALDPGETTIISTLPIRRDLTLIGNGATLRIEPESSFAFDVASGVGNLTITDLTLEIQNPEALRALVRLPAPEARVIFDNVRIAGDEDAQVPPVSFRRETGDTGPLNFSLGPTRGGRQASSAPAPELPLDEGVEPLGNPPTDEPSTLTGPGRTP